MHQSFVFYGQRSYSANNGIFCQLWSCGDRMKMSLSIIFFKETPTSPRVPFRVKFQLLGQLFGTSRPLAYSLIEVL